MTKPTKTCRNCRFRYGANIDYAKCVRTGTFCDLEMRYGGRCAGPETGVPQMNLWEPRKTIWVHIKSIFTKEST